MLQLDAEPIGLSFPQFRLLRSTRDELHCWPLGMHSVHEQTERGMTPSLDTKTVVLVKISVS